MIKVIVMYPNTPGARFDHEFHPSPGWQCKDCPVPQPVLGVAVGALGRATAMHAIAPGIPRSIEKLMREVEDFLRKQREGGTQG